MNLTTIYSMDNTEGSLAKSSDGIETPHIIQGAQVASPVSRLFLCVNTPVMVGRSGGLCARRTLGAVVSTRSIHLLSEIETSLEVVNKTISKGAIMPSLSRTRNSCSHLIDKPTVFALRSILSRGVVA